MSPSAPDSPTPWHRVAGITLALTVAVAALVVAFGWPAVSTAPDDLPVAISGPQEVTDGIAAHLEQSQPGAFAITTEDSADSARAAIEDRSVYGAFILEGDGLEVAVASAASPAVAQTLAQVGQGVASQLGATASVVDVVPAPADDPRGLGLAAAALPIALAGLIAGVAPAVAVRGLGRQLAVLASFAVVVSMATVAILEFWFGTITQHYWAATGAAALGIAATGVAVLGAASLFGRAGIGIMALVVVLLGNPLSGMRTAPEMTPAPWGDIGQLLPPGATGSLIRSTAYFDGAASAQPALVLLAWLVAGAVLLVAATMRAHSRA